MKLLVCAFVAITFSGSVFSQDLNKHLSEMLEQTKESFIDYSRRTPSEIYDGNYDQTDLLLFIRIGMIDSYDIIFPKTEINAYKTKLAIEISNIFDEAQLEAIVKMGNESVVNKKKPAKYFEVARLYKMGKLKENKIIKKL